MNKTIVFIHGACLTPRSWEKFIGFFESRGYKCLAPTWPYEDRPFEELRNNPPPELARLGVTEIVDHYEKIIKTHEERPILIGHSFGGLFVQLLLDRGLGAAGVAINSAPPKGVLSLQWSAIRSTAGVFLKWRGWKRIFYPSFPEFQYAVVHTLPLAEQRAAYDRHVVPSSARIFFQMGLALLDPHNAVRVNYNNADRAPLLFIAGTEDHLVPASMNKSNYAKYKSSAGQTDFKEFPGRTHWIIAQDGWVEVAGYIADWLDRLPNKKV